MTSSGKEFALVSSGASGGGWGGNDDGTSEGGSTCASDTGAMRAGMGGCPRRGTTPKDWH